MNVDIELEGIDKLLKQLNTLGGDLTHAVRRGREKLSGQIQAQAKQFVRVDTAQLKNSIEVANNEEESIVGTNAEHAIYNEFGTGRLGDPEVPHTEKEYWTYMGADGKFHTTHGIEPQPFMRPAAEFGEIIAPEIFAEEIEKEIKRYD